MECVVLTMDRLLLVDGLNLLFQMFYGMPARIFGKSGKPIQGTLGFIGALIKIVKLTQPTHLVVLFDKEQPSSRAELLPEYKANRVDYSQIAEEENPFSQLDDVYRALDYMGVAHTEDCDGEVDDVIAAYVSMYAKDMEILISSFDSDYFQLIDEHVSVLRYRGKCSQICDQSYLYNQFGIESGQYADWKCLTGDSADNIKGVRMIGPKTATALLHQFGTLEQMLARTEEIERSIIRQAIEASVDQLRLNQKLIRLSGKAAMPFSLEQLCYCYNGLQTKDILNGIGL